MYSWHACRCEWMQINFCLAHISSCFLAALNFSHVLVMIKSFRSALKQSKESFFPLCCLSHVYHVEHIPSFRARSLLKLYKHVKLIFIYFCKRDAKFHFDAWAQTAAATMMDYDVNYNAYLNYGRCKRLSGHCAARCCCSCKIESLSSVN